MHTLLPPLRDLPVLVIAPHPDDESFGCGGFIARLAAGGAQVHVQAVTVGDLPQLGAASETRTRVAEFEAACAKLGVAGQDIAWMDDARHMRLDVCPQYELVRLIESEARFSLATVNPAIVLMPTGTGFNQDHLAVHRAAFTAMRPHAPALKPVPPLVLGYAIPEEGWTIQPPATPFIVDTSGHGATKLAALACYGSQLRPGGHPRALAQIELADRACGGAYGLESAERFEVYRALW